MKETSVPFLCTVCVFYKNSLNTPQLPKENTIGIHYVEGVIKEEHFGKIIESILRIPRNEVCGIDERYDINMRNRFIFKLTTYDRYKSVCAQFSGRVIDIERGYRI